MFAPAGALASAAGARHTRAMTSKHAGRLLVECLQAEGAEMLFGVPGESFLPVLDALHDSPLRFVNSRNETGAAFMAEACGKLTGRPGLCLVTRGPGAAYAAAGVHTARHNSTAMIVLVGQAERGVRGRGAFQEVDYGRFYGDEVKWAAEIDAPERIPELVARAHAVALAGRPGPVVLSLPEDMLFARVEGDAKPAARGRFFPPCPDARGVAEALELLAAAERPLLLAGGGGWSEAARDGLRRFAEAWAVPVVVSFRRHDLMDNFSPCYAGDAGIGMEESLRRLFADADVILALGARLGEISTDGYRLLSCPSPAQRLIHVHADGGELGKVYQPRLGIVAAPEGFVSALGDGRPEPVSAGREAWRQRAREDFLARLEAPPATGGGLDMGQVMARLREVLPRDVIVANGAGNFALFPNRHLLYGRGARLLAPQNGIMGYGLPAAIVARLLHPQRRVVCFAGDGDLQMVLGELGSAKQLGAVPVILLCRNDMYGTIRAHQERRYPGRVSGTEMVNPDFVALARAYGFYGERVADAKDFAGAFERACAQGGLLELPISAQLE